MLFILILIPIVLILFVLITNDQMLRACFRKGNCIVYGTRGKGKDLIFSYVIRKSKRPYYSNIDYHCKKSKCTLKPIKDLEIFPNNYDSLIKGKYFIIPKNLEEKHDFYISDAGIHLPSQLDSKLHNNYPSLTMTYALSRQLWSGNIHCNSQSIGRIWKALREQADYYIKALNTIKCIPFVLITKFRIYDKYDTAVKDYRPMSRSFANESQKALYEMERSKNGMIKTGYIIQLKRNVKYDSRVFHEYIYGVPYSAPKLVERLKSLFHRS